MNILLISTPAQGCQKHAQVAASTDHQKKYDSIVCKGIRGMSVAESIVDAINGLFDTVSGDTETICRDAQSSNLSDWKTA